MVDDIEDKGIVLDKVVKNEGIYKKNNGVENKVWEMEKDEWRRVVDVKMKGKLKKIREIKNGMVEERRGWIVKKY